MTVLQAFILGIVQGVTEFLPISSDGHLLVMEHVFGLQLPPEELLIFNILLHGGTLLALVAIYGHSWWKILLASSRKDQGQIRLLLSLIVASIPAVIVGLLFEDKIGGEWTTISIASAGFIVTALSLLAGEWGSDKPKHPLAFFSRKNPGDHTSLLGALFIGVAQAAALLPGVSRSGLTISAGRITGLSRRAALDFSFLMAVPVIAGATLLALKNALTGSIPIPPLTVTLTGISTSFLTSVFAIVFLRRFVIRHSLVWFVPYLVALAFLILL